MKTYIFNEKKIVNILNIIPLAIFALTGIVFPFIITPILYFKIGFDPIYALGIFLLSLPCTIPFILLSNYLSTINEFTDKFLKEIKDELKQADSIEKLQSVRTKLWDEAVNERNMIRLSYPLSIKKIINEIDNKLDILFKIK